MPKSRVLAHDVLKAVRVDKVLAQRMAACIESLETQHERKVSEAMFIRQAIKNACEVVEDA